PLAVPLLKDNGRAGRAVVTLFWHGDDRFGEWACLLSEVRQPGRTSAEDVLSCMVDACGEAMWCIEFDEPVDTAQPRGEIIRQIFENTCHWTLCNRAMARIYGVPDGGDLNREPVSRFFARSPENEWFIGQLIDSSYSIDGVASCDHLHDGTPVFLENTVRCHIEDGLLWRMIGTLRDLTTFKETEVALTRREESVKDVLGAIADVVVVIDRDACLCAANPAFEKLFGVPVEPWLGRTLTPIVDLERYLHPWVASLEPFTVMACRPGQGAILCEATLAPVPDGFDSRFVAVLRPARARSEPRPRVMIGRGA
ncbi:MAG: PAS domain-containing protein, partial [Methylacidiphilales bacterium]|nr:PAS domain-containing protein [Candidatus Methylacidiphilales bacterium]